MTHYIETQTENGSSIRIEVEDTSKPTPGFTRQPSAADVSNEAVKDAYNQVLNTIRACADGVVDTIQNLESLPSAASIDFAIKVDAEAGVMIARSREDTQFRISLTWKQVELGEEQKES
jgi:hypothetical protein